MQTKEQELNTLKDIVSLPTAPFKEHYVQSYIREFAANHNFGLKTDKYGNILLHYPGTGKQNNTPWVIQAHMDHPGFTFLSRKGKKAKAVFWGGVDVSYFKGTSMVFLPEGAKPVKGTIASVKKDPDLGCINCNIDLERPVDIQEGTLGMWNLPTWRQAGDNLTLRVADDLVGTASVLLTLLRLKNKKAKCSCYGMLARAEECGFIGSAAAVKTRLLDKEWPVLGIETSKAQPASPLGSGVVIRLGDRLSLFDSQLCSALRCAAEKLTADKSQPDFKYTMNVMPGGATESTLFQLHGYKTCAVCLPLGNYHNMSPKAIAGEKINLNDFYSLLALLEIVTQSDSTGNAANKKLKKALDDIYKKRSSNL